MDVRNLFRSIINPWVVVGAFVFALSLFALTVFLFWLTRPQPKPIAPATAVLAVIAAPTSTLPAPTSQATESPTPTSAIRVTPPPGVINKGDYVQITGTGGDGLRIRSDPGLNSQVNFIALEAEVFIAKDGPRQVDGYTWWYLVAPYEESRNGWAVSNYLRVVQP